MISRDANTIFKNGLNIDIARVGNWASDIVNNVDTYGPAIFDVKGRTEGRLQEFTNLQLKASGKQYPYQFSTQDLGEAEVINLRETASSLIGECNAILTSSGWYQRNNNPHYYYTENFFGDVKDIAIDAASGIGGALGAGTNSAFDAFLGKLGGYAKIGLAVGVIALGFAWYQLKKG